MTFRLLVVVWSAIVLIIQAKCAPRSVTITYKADSGTNIRVYRMCGNKVCGPALLSLLTICSKIYCRGSRCNTCTAKLSAFTNRFALRKFYEGKKLGRYGVKFDDASCPFYAFTSDWVSSSSDWYSRNRWLVGCKSRISCRARGGKACRAGMPFDVAVAAQGCYATLYGFGNAESLNECIAGNIGGGVPAGEVYGRDCPARPL